MHPLCPNSERNSAMAAIRLAGRLGSAYLAGNRELESQMIKLSRIGHVNLRVADQEASKRFYRDGSGSGSPRRTRITAASL